mmetsp:Transcript_73987/g.214063  ORF Transcript_73987/g.214063 Transcript_73987/m.214063 type:complete len:418 (+) Transcript_73987:58-1311(+)
MCGRSRTTCAPPMRWTSVRFLRWCVPFLAVMVVLSVRATTRAISASTWKMGFPTDPPASSTTTAIFAETWRMSFSTDSPASSPLSIFYNVYIPEENATAIQIVSEQLTQIGEGLRCVQQAIPLLYTTVGRTLAEASMVSMCGKYSDKISFTHLAHLETGYEEHTLGAVHDYCSAHPRHRVIYLHNKGSYHETIDNHHFRRHLTDAVMSNDCIEHASSEDCNVCGLLFNPFPEPGFPGNMFIAKCSYIRKLVHPTKFTAMKDIFFGKVSKFIADGTLQAAMYNISVDWFFGRNRYALEHWVGSHPALGKVCYVSRTHSPSFWMEHTSFDRNPEHWKFDTVLHDPPAAWWLAYAGNAPNDTRREFFLLPGMLLKWFEWYGEVPPPTSWVWSWYPDGEFWRTQVVKYRSRAVEVANACAH